MEHWKVTTEEINQPGSHPDSLQLAELSIEIENKFVVAANPQRDLHGPCVVRAANGDLLLCHQDSEQHLGGDGYVHQWRSRDQGMSWQDEGAIVDWRGRDMDALFGEYGACPNGDLVVFIQRRKPRSDDDGIRATWYALSSDQGRSWHELGPVSPDEYAFLSPRNVITHHRFMYVTAWSPQGHALYVSVDNGKQWQRRSVIFPHHPQLFPELKEMGPPFYPHIEVCPDGSLLAMTYYTPGRNVCYSRRSYDLGLSWSAIQEETALPFWAPRLRRIGENLMILTGRDYLRHSTVACFSTDSGHHWSTPIVLDTPVYKGSYAYTDAIAITPDRLWVFTSSPQSENKGDIISIMLKLTKNI